MATITARTGARSWATATDWVGDACPIDNTDSFVIPPDCSMLMNQDQSGWTGLLGGVVQAQGAGSAPGLLYWAAGTSGYLKIKTGNTIAGDSDTNKGRILANSNGIWGTTTPLPFADKAVILLEGTAKIDALYLDIALYATHPTNWYVETYKTAYGPVAQATNVTPDDDYIDWGTTPPSAGTAVRAKSSGTLPTGLSADVIYYVRSISGNKCKLATQNLDVCIVDITAVGSGNITMYEGYATGYATKTLNVIQDVTSDTPWVTTAGHNRVALCDIGPVDSDTQRDTLATINAGSLVITAADVDSAQYPCSRIYLLSRNVSIRSAGTTAGQPIVDYGVGTHGGVFGCEICNTAGSGATQYGDGIYKGVGHTISGIIGYCNCGMRDGAGTISGALVCNSNSPTNNSSATAAACTLSSTGILHGGSIGSYRAVWTVEGTILGCNTGVDYPDEGTTISGKIIGCNSGTYRAGGPVTISGLIASCANGVFRTYFTTVSGTVIGCTNGFNETRICKLTVTGVIQGCTTGANTPYNNEIAGTIKACTTGISLAGGNCLLAGATIGGVGVGLANTTDIAMTYGIAYGAGTTLASSGTTRVGSYKTYDYPANVTIRDFGGVDEAIGCWSGGGSVITNGGGSHVLTAEHNAYWTWLAIPFRAVSGQTVTITVTAATLSGIAAWAVGGRPVFAIADPAVGWEGVDELLDSETQPEDTDPHTHTLTCLPDHDCELYFLVRAKGGDSGGAGTETCTFTFDISVGGSAAAGTRAWASAG